MMTNEELLETYSKMCYGKTCSRCPLWKANGGSESCTKFIGEHPGTAATIIEQWRNENIIKQGDIPRCTCGDYESPKKKIKISRVEFNGPATIVFWPDGTKTVVKCTKDDKFSHDTGVAMATLKKMLGGKYGAYKKASKKAIHEWTNKEMKKFIDKCVDDVAEKINGCS